MLQYYAMKLKLIEGKKEAGDAISFIFEPENKIQWVAGQFLIYFLPHETPDIRGKQRFFTISSAPFERHIMLTTRIFPDNPSSFKKALNEMKPGDTIDAKGPDGDFTVLGPNKHFVFIAGGIGITPFRSIIADLAHKNLPLNITLLYANSTSEFPFKDELEKIADDNPNFKIHYIVSPQHIDEDVVKQTVPNLSEPIFYVSGPEKMVEILSEMLMKMGISEDHIKQDFFPGYEAF